MIDVYFYNFDKRLNSTATPSISSGTLYECTLKDDTSILTPTLKLRLSTKPTYNYFQFYNRFYWITDIVSLANNMWAISGRVDVLGTFRLHIKQTSAFVLYDSTPNTQLPDNRLAIKTDCENFTSEANMPWGFSTDQNAGTYFIATVGEKKVLDIDFSPNDGNFVDVSVSNTERNGTGVYCIPASSIDDIGFDLEDFFNNLDAIVGKLGNDVQRWISYMNPAGLHPQDVVEALVKCLFGGANILIDVTTEFPTRLALLIIQNLIGGGNALQNVKASYWLPFNMPSGSTQSDIGNKLALGTYTDIVSGLERVIKPVITAIDIPVTIPWHFDDWRNVSCTEIMLYIPLIGCVSIPPEVVKGNDTLYLRFSLNIYSGDLACEIRCNGSQIGTYGTNCAMNILIGDSNINMGGAVNTVIAGVTKNYGAMASGVVDTLSGMNTSVGGIGGGAGTGLTNKIVCNVRTHNTSQAPSALLSTIGTPTRQLKTLSGSGYCQCMDAQLNCGYIESEPYPTRTEIEEVNAYLNTGVYLE